MSAQNVTDLLTYTTQQAADVLQLSESQVRRLIGRGEMPAVHLGSNVRIPKSALSIWLDREALASLREQAVTEFIARHVSERAVERLDGRSEPTGIGVGSRRTRRNNKRPDRSNDQSAGAK